MGRMPNQYFIKLPAAGIRLGGRQKLSLRQLKAVIAISHSLQIALMAEGEIAFFTIKLTLLLGATGPFWDACDRSHTQTKTHLQRHTTFSSGSILARERSMDQRVRQTLLSALKENRDL